MFLLIFLRCYAPTENATENDKNMFYDQLNTVISSLPRNDIVVILGDFNAKVGNNNDNIKEIMGKHGLGSVCNNNGERLIDFCSTNEFFIGGTKFPHKDIHKYTWQSPDGVTRNQIDHVLMSKRFQSSLTNVRTMRSADIYSDHKLLIAEIKVKHKKLHTKNKI